MRSVLLVTLLVCGLALPSFAESGDAAAVVQYCGKPSVEQQGVSQVTNRMERSLTYGNIMLHFEPSANGWTFLSGWYDHLPMTQGMVESRMPCFKQAMGAVHSQQVSGTATNEDPAIRAQTAAPAADVATFGIQHLWLIVVLVLVVVILFALPGARHRSQVREATLDQPRYQRRPVLERFRRNTGPRLDV